MKELNLGKDKINKLILSFSIPCVISMLIIGSNIIFIIAPITNIILLIRYL